MSRSDARVGSAPDCSARCECADCPVGWLAHSAHVFWPDDLGWLGNSVIKGDQVLGHGQITDTYLLALAVHNRGCMASFDERLSTAAVNGGKEALCLIPVGC